MGRAEAKSYAIVSLPSVDIRAGLRPRDLSVMNQAALGIFVVSQGHLR